MIGNVFGVRTRQWAGIGLGLLTCITAQMAAAADCPGNPDALGTSRTLVVDPREHPRIGTMQYPETLPLEDHEVVLTFDDGPLPHNSNQILQILAAQCVKATFFEIGRMAQSFPEGVRKLRDAGHTIGTHSQNHPLTMNRMPIERARQEIDDGIASVKAALGDDTALAPFFRIPGLLRATDVEDYLASQGIQTWSADFPADDWRHIPSSRVYDLAMKRIEEKGKGILLLHDIQARTVAALPRILHELKARGYRIVHVVPATPERPATPTEPQQWQLHPSSENVAISRWPKIPGFAFANADTLPAPALSDFDWQDIQFAEPSDRAQRHARGVPLPRQSPWPRQASFTLDQAAMMLPVPAQNIFEIEENPHATMASLAPYAHRAEHAAPAECETRVAETGEVRRKTRANGAHANNRTIGNRTYGKPYAARAARSNPSHAADRGTRRAAHAPRGTLKRLVQVKKRNV
jgi:peptidoglycan/xylan/chitin deacetylase (PgdA/CDA1 family)